MRAAQTRIGVQQVLTGKLINGAYLAYVTPAAIAYPNYQRDEIKPHTKAIAKAWDFEFARPLLLSKREGRLNGFDGRQTATAAIINGGVTKLLAFIWENWTYEREAQAFFVLNQVPKKMEGWKKFDADKKAGNSTNQLILNTLHNTGLTTPFHPQVAHPGLADIDKSNVVLDVVKKGGLPLLVSFAKAIKGWKVEGVVPDTAKRTDFGRALRDLLFAHQDDTAHVLRALKIVTPDQIRQLANTMESKGRIDATQIRLALEQVTGFAGVRRRLAA
jgi:hypothetical protein